MISVIVSTYQPHYLQSLKENIAQSIGVEYELIAIENKAQYSLCEAYNMGVSRSQYDYYCFVHEEVRFDSQNWGKFLIDKYFTLHNVGILGLA